MKPEENSQGPEKDLQSKEYRAKLLHKLNCLISVLEVALAKVRVNSQSPAADMERLTRIRINLENTLNVCKRAKIALEKKEPMPASFAKQLPHLQADAQKVMKKKRRAPFKPKFGRDGLPRMTYRDYVEFTSVDEYHKFKSKAPIRAEEVKSVNWGDLEKKLGGIDTLG